MNKISFNEINFVLKLAARIENNIMAKTKTDAFADALQTLNKSREILASEHTHEELKEAFKFLCDEYEKLIGEAQFLTKVSDKLEAKLNKTNEQLRLYNLELAHEAEDAKQLSEKISKQNKSLFEEKKSLDSKVNTFQQFLIITIGFLLALVLLLLYYVVFRTS